MRNKKLVLVAVLAAFALLVAACGDDGGEGAGQKMCQVTDFGGIDDQSFNQTAWKGFQQAEDELGVEIAYLESDDATDYAPNIQSFMDQGCKLIVTVGFNLAADTAQYACNNPEQLFAILDEGPAFYPGSAWADADGNALCEFTNVRGITFQTDEAAFLAGYLSAGVTETGKVATFGGIAYPTVTIFMNGFAQGVAHYNEVKGTAVEVLGWDPATQEGIFVGNFESQDDGRAQGESLNDEGADIILPVAGPVGLGTAAAAAERGFLVIGVDADQYLTAPEYGVAWLTSILKNMDVAVMDTVTNVVESDMVGEAFVGTLANGGLGLAPYHDNEDRVSAELAAEIEQLKADIIAAGGLAAFLEG
jgi:basic membrane protein A